jgi:hypothetical protein
MKDIGLPEFGSPKDFVDLHDIVKRHAEHDSTREAKIMQVASMTPSQVRKFMEHPIKAHTTLHCLSAKVIKYREQVIEMKQTCYRTVCRKGLGSLSQGFKLA